jgi:glucose/arabinose dehydrogenase
MTRPSIIRLTFFALLSLALFTTAPSLVFAQSSGWPQITLTLVQNELSSPVHVTHAGDGSDRLFIVEQAGNIRIFKEGALLSTAFLSIGGPGGRVSCCGEQGLLSVAFPPDYATKQHFYVAYTNPGGALVIARYRVTANPDLAAPASEEILLTIPHPTNSNHNGGQLAFSPNDGYLYIGTGDGGGGGDSDNNAQDPLSLLGKMLRIDVESDPGTNKYVVPDSNPYKDNTNALPEIWALGLRNPWRFGFDRQTGDLYVGDVGQNSFEEIDFQPASSSGGENYGWRCREGFNDYDGHSDECAGRTLTDPAAEYSHQADCSVTGGFIYRGTQYRNLQGLYFYGDFCSGQIRGLRRSTTTWESQPLLTSALNISSFGEDENGELYVVDLGGALYRLTALPPDVDLTGSWDLVSSTCRTLSSGLQCQIQGRFLLRNQGAQRALAGAYTKFYLSQDATLSPDDVEIRKRWVGRLSSGRTVRLFFRKNLPRGETALSQFLIAVVDAENGIAETQENNNIIVSTPIN